MSCWWPLWRVKYAETSEGDVICKCPACGRNDVGIPWSFLVESSVTATCKACGTSYRSTLSGAMNAVRGAVVAFIATALGMSVFVFLHWWKIWVVAVVALLALDAFWKLHLHKSAIWRSAKSGG